jgi:transporter family-2 protein
MLPSIWTAPLYLLALCAGSSFVFQQVVNANLRLQIGSSLWAGFISYVGGTLCMVFMIIASREPGLSVEAVSRSSLVSWTGGLFGAIYIAISILLLPRLGAATLVALIVVGQMLASLVFDHFGLLGVPVHPASVVRIAGAACLLLGAVLIRL